MKKNILALSCMAALLAFGSEAKAADSATANASVLITTPLSLTYNSARQKTLVF